MEYYSHVLGLPDAPPFDRSESRFTSWIGNFVKPLRELGLHDRYWFTYYGHEVRYRVYTNKYDELKPHIDALVTTLRLDHRNVEKDLTLIGDLGHDRFLSSKRSDKSPNDRAYMVLTYLHSIAELVVDNLVDSKNGYWELEHSANAENPNGSNFESLHHLLANMSQVPISILLALDGRLLGTFWGQPVKSESRVLSGQPVTELFLRY